MIIHSVSFLEKAAGIACRTIEVSITFRMKGPHLMKIGRREICKEKVGVKMREREGEGIQQAIVRQVSRKQKSLRGAQNSINFSNLKQLKIPDYHLLIRTNNWYSFATLHYLCFFVTDCLFLVPNHCCNTFYEILM